MTIHRVLSVFMMLVIISCSENGDAPPVTGNKDSARGRSREPVNCRALLTEAKKMDSVLMQEAEIDPAIANKAITAFTQFAYYCKSDTTLSPVFLLKTAQVARSVNNAEQAKVALEQCIEEYPAFRNRPAALFMLAHLYDETVYLNNDHEARRLYQQVIAEYPGTDWAESARAALKVVGKSDEELLQEFNKQKSKSGK